MGVYDVEDLRSAVLCLGVRGWRGGGVEDVEEDCG